MATSPLLLSKIEGSTGPQARGIAQIQDIMKGPALIREFPNPVRFAGTVDPRLHIDLPFRVAMTSLNGSFIAKAEEIQEFGEGSSAGEALDDLGKTIAELYFSLKADKDRLSSDLSGVFETLRAHLSEIR